MKKDKSKIILYVIILLIIIAAICFIYTLTQYLLAKSENSNNTHTLTPSSNSTSLSNNQIITVDNNSTIRIVTDYDENMFKGHKSLIFFWASWCSHCQEEYDVLKTALTDYQNKGYTIYVISHDNDINELAEYMRKNDLNYEVYFDEKRIIRSNINPEANSVPLTYILDKDAKLIDSHEGPITLEELDQLIERNQSS